MYYTLVMRFEFLQCLEFNVVVTKLVIVIVNDIIVRVSATKGPQLNPGKT